MSTNIDLNSSEKEAIRKYMIKVVVPVGTVFSILTMLIGFTISNSINSATTKEILDNVTPSLISASERVAEAKYKSETLLKEVKDMSNSLKTESTKVSELLSQNNLKEGVANLLINDTKLKNDLIEGVNSELDSRLKKLEARGNWSDVRMDYNGMFNPDYRYRVKVLNPQGGNAGYNQGYIYLTTIIDNLMWGAWTSGTSSRGYIEISNLDGKLKITDGLFTGVERQNFKLQVQRTD